MGLFGSKFGHEISEHRNFSQYINEIQSCAAQSSHENPLEPDDYAKPGQNIKLKVFLSF